MYNKDDMKTMYKIHKKNACETMRRVSHHLNSRNLRQYDFIFLFNTIPGLKTQYDRNILQNLSSSDNLEDVLLFIQQWIIRMSKFCRE